MPLQPTTTADNNDFNMISELNTSSLTPTQLKTGIEKGYALSSLVSTPTQIDGKVIPIDTIALLRAKTVTPSTVWVSGYYTKGDGAFGSNIFEWDSTSVEDDNGGTIIKLTSVTTGRYKLKFDGSVNVKWFGVIGDGEFHTTNNTRLQNALNIGGKIQLYDTIKVSEEMTLVSNSYIHGGKIEYDLLDGISYNAVFNMSNVHDITLDNIHFSCRSDLEETVYDASAIGIDKIRTGGEKTCYNITIKNCIFSELGFGGISVSCYTAYNDNNNTSNYKIEGNTFYMNYPSKEIAHSGGGHQYGLDFFMGSRSIDDGAVEGVDILNNTFYLYDTALKTMGFKVGGSKNVNISGNKVISYRTLASKAVSGTVELLCSGVFDNNQIDGSINIIGAKDMKFSNSTATKLLVQSRSNLIQEANNLYFYNMTISEDFTTFETDTSHPVGSNINITNSKILGNLTLGSGSNINIENSKINTFSTTGVISDVLIKGCTLGYTTTRAAYNITYDRCTIDTLYLGAKRIANELIVTNCTIYDFVGGNSNYAYVLKNNEIGVITDNSIILRCCLAYNNTFHANQTILSNQYLVTVYNDATKLISNKYSFYSMDYATNNKRSFVGMIRSIGTNSIFEETIASAPEGMTQYFIYDTGTGTRALINNAEPTMGDYYYREVIYNSYLRAGAPMGWVCTVAGTAGVNAVFKELPSVVA